jgi:uncharacterized alpha-E superfamily protein
MLHNQGWHFIQIGRHLERIIGLTAVLRVFMEQSYSGGNGSHASDYFTMLTLLKSVTAFEAYCKVYNPDLQASGLLEFLLFNGEFPHSAQFCINQILTSITALSDATMMHKNSRLHRLVGRVQSNLSYSEISEVLQTSFGDYLVQIRQQTLDIHDALFDTYITYPIESVLR